MRNRNNVVSIRYSDDEYKVLQKRIKESGQTKQSYIINATLYAKISSADDVNEMKEQSRLLFDIDRQLKGIGTNINQMAHVANGKDILPTVDTLYDIGATVTEIKEEADDVWQLIRQSMGRQNLKQD